MRYSNGGQILYEHSYMHLGGYTDHANGRTPTTPRTWHQLFVPLSWRCVGYLSPSDLSLSVGRAYSEHEGEHLEDCHVTVGLASHGKLVLLPQCADANVSLGTAQRSRLDWNPV